MGAILPITSQLIVKCDINLANPHKAEKGCFKKRIIIRIKCHILSSEICQIISLGFKQRCRMCSETEVRLLTRNTTLQSFTSIEILMSHLCLREDNLISIIPRDAQLQHKGTQCNTFWGRAKKKGKSSVMHAGCARLCTHLEHQPKINLRIPRE